MPFPASQVGLQLTPFETSITPRRILAYAAGIGAADDAFLDDMQPGGLDALPFQCVSPEWPVLLSMRSLVGNLLSLAEARRGVHAVQDSTFHRPMRPGDRLITEGRLVSATTIRSGVLTVCKLETRERDTGVPVTTTWTSSIYRDVALEGAPIILEVPPVAEGLNPSGPDAETVTLHIPREMPHVYSECANIWNPIHTERREALAAGLPDIILHGTATWAVAGLVVLRRYGNSKATSLRRMTGRFSGVVIPGEDIVVRHQAGPDGVVNFEVRTSSGTPAISQGACWLR